MAIEDFFAYLFCLAAIFDPLRKATTAMGRLRRAEAAARRIFDVIDAPSEADEATASLPGAETRDCPALTGDLEFQDVSFAYREDAPEVLRGVRLTIRAGETVAFVGPNGSGKTTLVSMVPRLYLPTRGQILWNGTDLREFSVRRLRRQIGLVTQDAIIFKGTVHDNIALDDPEIPREAVVRAARKARADEFIAELRDAEGNTGYDAVLAEHGHSLSGGQRQRIALARAILRDPSVLILDEATSQIDSRAEALIQEALAAFTQGRTTLVIAHRLSTVQHADRIVVMDGGAVAAVGTHAELAGSCGLYRDMCEQQFLTPAPKPDAPAAVGAAGTGA
jgi:ABC-type multidrug transport system fused ATPase/permease subunit